MEDHLEVTEDIQIEQIKTKSVKGVFSLTFRRILLQIVALIASVLLARFLSRAEFGIFAIVSFIVNFFGFFSDVGLAAALIQKKGELTKEDLRSTFTTQMVLVGTLVIVLLIGAPIIVNTFYKNTLGNSGIVLIQVLAFSLMLASLKSVPSVILERKLQFNKLVIPEIAETLIFNILAVVLAYMGYGVWSFIIAILVRGIIGVTIIYSMVRWPIGFSWDKTSLKTLFSFGVPYQLNGLIALIKDNIVPTFVASFLGAQAVGDINWAQKYAFLPLNIMNDIIRITFPTYARLQEHPDLLKKALEKSLYFISLALYPALFGFIALAPWIVKYVFTDKWIPALPLFYLFCFSTFWASISTTFTNALFAIGKAKVVLNFMILWTVLTWTLTPLCTWIYGKNGVGIASALISFTSIGVIMVMKRHVDIKIIPVIGSQLLMAIIMGIVVFYFSQSFVHNFVTLIAAILLGSIVYSIGMYLIAGDRLIAELKGVLKYTNKGKN